MKFKYREYGEAKRPVIPVILLNHGSYIRCEVLVDSGSDRCYFDADIADILGIRPEECNTSEVLGVGGKVSKYFTHPVTIVVGDTSYRVDAGFMPFLGGGVVSYGFVGQKGFFDHFVVKFNHKKNEIEVDNVD